ncbi:hypothetical protein [uncultured Methanobrevibacter sp.]|uniref:hypothetical protein n=1 Tax=uncultured Methanobrevibacter sp. TaxID=253161 RepID=UPI0025F2C65B|nr:hypothetical protein [uncultured Methanobrevibacter sp.]
MKTKEIFIVLAILCLLVSVAGVSAEDNNTIKDNKETVLTSFDDSNKVLESSISENLTKTSKTISDFRDEIENSDDNSVVKIEKDYYFNNDSTPDNRGITILKNNVTIDGQGHTFDGNSSNLTFLFRIHGDNVVLKNMNFINWELYNSYDIIEWIGNSGLLEDCRFINNTGISGGTVDWTGISGLMSGCEFINNTADNGGAVYWYGEDGHISDSTFYNNTAYEAGGALYVYGRNFTLSYSNFELNSADVGGAIYWENDRGLIYETQFINNTADTAGALYLLIGPFNVMESTFINNTADDYGGAIYWESMDGNITECYFLANNASNGGAVYCDNYCDVTINKTYFENNSADFGGAVMIEDNGNIDNSLFESNSATSYGGAIYADSEATINNTDFTGNKAETGGAVAMADGNISNSTFTKNTANSGGAVAAAGEVVVDGVSFEANKAKDKSNNIISQDGNIITKNCDSDTPIILNGIEMEIDDSIDQYTYGEIIKIPVAITQNGNSVNGGVVSTKINGKTYSANVVNGTATIAVPKLNVGKYSLTVNYVRQGYNDPALKYNVTVVKSKAIVIAFAKRFIINYPNKFNIALKDGKGKVIVGKKVIVRVNGKYLGTAKTNSKGIATLIISAVKFKILKAGYKNLAITFTDSNYNTASKVVKIRILKENTKIAAKINTYKSSLKIKKFAVVLKNYKNKPVKNLKVTLKVNGKLYVAKTNSKGQAIFKITKLTKKGTFISIVKFSGNYYYNTISKKVKIRVI